MNRREFITLSLAATALLVLPSTTQASVLNLSAVDFSQTHYNQNNAQVIMVFLYGGASQLCANLTNIDTIKAHSQSDYDSYFRGVTSTQNHFWQEAGGTHLEAMLSAGDATIFRTCYSQVREDAGNKAHGECTAQNQKGSFDDTSSGIVANLAAILEDNKMINENTIMPFVTLEGESQFYSQGSLRLQSYLRAVGLDEQLNNPYSRNNLRNWVYYTPQERETSNYNNNETGFDPALDTKMNTMAQKYNTNEIIKNDFDKRKELSLFIDTIAETTTPDLGSNAYPTNNNFADKLETAINVMASNPDTKVITLGTAGLGGWDDHNEARDYVTRCESLFTTIKSAVAHLKAINKEDNISIMVFGEFGRNVNLNAALGWDHGNLQNFYVFAGKGYFKHKGVVGETTLEDVGAVNRLYLQPKSNSYWFEPLSIAATFYKIFGIQNPEIITGGYQPVNIF
jgi:uncharacterized protein (DUF1501 family)